MITINFQSRCDDAEHCAKLEEVRESLKSGDLSSVELKNLLRRELAGCCGSCDEKNVNLKDKLFKV